MHETVIEDSTAEPFDLALLEYYSTNGNMQRYEALIDTGVEAGDSLAQYAKATWYLHGQPSLRIRKDIRRAIPLLEESARTLNRAMYDLAVCYSRGVGVRRDDTQAYKLFARAARAGSIPAMLAQAECLIDGTGVRKQPAKGKRLCERAQALISKFPK